MNFLHHYSLPLLNDNTDPEIFAAWKQFALRATIATQTQVSATDISNVETQFATFLDWYYQKIYQ